MNMTETNFDQKQSNDVNAATLAWCIDIFICRASFFSSFFLLSNPHVSEISIRFMNNSQANKKGPTHTRTRLHTPTHTHTHKPLQSAENKYKLSVHLLLLCEQRMLIGQLGVTERTPVTAV